ncbi:MAG: hypothetical protein EP319_12060 [Deltaproteobacteria bacterium]|nr:MAG: hypothetical protein EP319_12060 [Deltaproteobacteria bacterium]
MSNTTQTTTEQEVLFQKLGETWYVFTEVENDFIYSALPTGMNPMETKLELFEVIEEHMQKVAKHYKTTEEVA